MFHFRIGITVFVFVLMGWSLLLNALRPFKIYCALPNLGRPITRTWICRLNFAQTPIFSGLRFFNDLKSQTRDPQLKVPPGGLELRIFTSWKNPSTSAGFQPANLGSRGEHVTSRPPRPTYFPNSSVRFSDGQVWIWSWVIILVRTLW